MFRPSPTPTPHGALWERCPCGSSPLPTPRVPGEKLRWLPATNASLLISASPNVSVKVGPPRLPLSALRRGGPPGGRPPPGSRARRSVRRYFTPLPPRRAPGGRFWRSPLPRGAVGIEAQPIDPSGEERDWRDGAELLRAGPSRLVPARRGLRGRDLGLGLRGAAPAAAP